MRTDAELEDIATMLADLTEQEEAGVQLTLLSIRAERARREEERLAALRAQSDLEVVIEALDFGREDNRDPRAALALLRDAGFVRHATLEAAYREGYDRGAYDASGGGYIPSAEDEPEYVRYRDLDLGGLAKKEA